jgi:hypothetical protein
MILMIKKGNIEIDGTLYAYDIRFIRGKKGDILVKGNREWIRIPAGHDGLVLTSRGEGEIPEWRASVPGTCDNADKLDGQHGSYYLNRANHTGTQTRSTISDFAHKDTHKTGGSDAFTNTDTIEALVKRIQAQGPTNLEIGTIDDGQFLKRSSGSIVGSSIAVGDLPAHKDTHKTGGSDAFTSTDEIEAIVKRMKESGGTVLALGSVADGQFLKRSGTSIVSAVPPVSPHKSTHVSGGTDAFTSTDLLEAIIKRIRESGGPTDLLVGSIPDGKFLKRSGTSIIGADPPAGGGGVQIGTYFATNPVTGGAEQEIASVTITTTTNPVKIEFMVKATNLGADDITFTFKFFRDGSEINTSDRPSEHVIPNAIARMISIHSCDTPPSAGSHTYAIRVSAFIQSPDVYLSLRRLTVIAS